MSTMELDRTLNRAPEKVRTIHIMGICGTGMAALAGMLQQSGYRVSGSDNHVYPPMSNFLQQIGIPIKNGYSAENLIPAPDLVIVAPARPRTCWRRRTRSAEPRDDLRQTGFDAPVQRRSRR